MCSNSFRRAGNSDALDRIDVGHAELPGTAPADPSMSFFYNGASDGAGQAQHVHALPVPGRQGTTAGANADDRTARLG